ncbi:hypothetical protein L861_02685 [Litchfieldella anticariensis FP35 = DSM 16096]|uniref:Uncharacterized protein n=1 Tax=Litchfieldella anticariensis (strain DSM 16096 / CECT 5854 / CIP 108499 / LMG 22089 / FP35) TaxID=1121939 RepID=S2KQS2_LITA3|nr:hypothetical protein L861_02685 [Halomonas anticariensis FP35 = DSM 16096]
MKQGGQVFQSFALITTKVTKCSKQKNWMNSAN